MKNGKELRKWILEGIEMKFLLFFCKHKGTILAFNNFSFINRRLMFLYASKQETFM